jgi:hypothetical protein
MVRQIPGGSLSAILVMIFDMVKDLKVISGKGPGKQPILNDTSGHAERTYGAPCVVLVINDNPYGLMVALSYIYRTCP